MADQGDAAIQAFGAAMDCHFKYLVGGGRPEPAEHSVEIFLRRGEGMRAAFIVLLQPRTHDIARLEGIGLPVILRRVRP